MLSTLEIRGEGVQWNNAGSALSQDESFNLGTVYGMLILDSIIYMTIAWSVNLSLRLTVDNSQYGFRYIDAVFPGKYGIPKPFYFFVTPSYWLGRPIGQIKSMRFGSSLEVWSLAKRYCYIIAVSFMQMSDLTEEHASSYKTAHETEPKDLECGVSVKGLTKIYKVSCMIYSKGTIMCKMVV